MMINVINIIFPNQINPKFIIYTEGRWSWTGVAFLGDLQTDWLLLRACYHTTHDFHLSTFYLFRNQPYTNTSNSRDMPRIQEEAADEK